MNSSQKINCETAHFSNLLMSRTKAAPSSGKLVEIELPLEGTSTKLNINATTTAQQVHDIIIKRPFYENTAYAFSLAPSNSSKKQPLAPEAILAKESVV